MSSPLADGVVEILDRLAVEVREQLEGIPEADLNTWRPALGLQDVNTFYALTTHLVSAGEYWILHAAGGQPSDRNRPAEFVSTGELAPLLARMDRWLADSRVVLAELTDVDLAKMFVRGGDEPLTRSRAECVIHAVQHTAAHLGHLQLQRQIWNAEHGLT